MKKTLILLSGVLLVLAGCKEPAGDLPYRWFYVANRLQSDRDLQNVLDIVRRAAQYDLNGMVLSAQLDFLDRQSPAYFRRLQALKDTCESRGIEIIPMIFSVGYGSSALAHNPHLAAGLPVKEQPFLVRGKRLVLLPDPQIGFPGGDLESFSGNKASRITAHDLPGKVSVPDRRIFRKGRASLRFQNIDQAPHGNARLIQSLAVAPYRPYRIRLFARTENLQPAGAFLVQILGEQNQILRLVRPTMQDGAWTEVLVDFNSLGNRTVRVYAGVWNGKGGRFWLDDFRLEEVALINLLQRPGTPVSVTDATTGETLVAGRDYQIVPDRSMTFRFDHPGAEIRVLRGSRLKTGDRVLVSYYHGLANREHQVSICMSEPEVYRLWETQAQLLAKYLQPQKFFLSMDEIRSGGTCAACRNRHLTMAEILGDCVSRQREILRKVSPDAELFIWSDMFDPNHNAHANHYQVEGDFSGSWRYLPDDITVVCWNYAIRKKSISHFDRNGFAVMAAAYYDVDDPENPNNWLLDLLKAKKPKGIIYTTWQNRYDFMPTFSEVIRERLLKRDEQK